MAVRVDEAGRYREAATVNDLGVCPFQVQNVVVTPDREYVATANRNGGGRGCRRIHRQQVGALDDQIGRVGCILQRCRPRNLLCADRVAET